MWGGGMPRAAWHPQRAGGGAGITVTQESRSPEEDTEALASTLPAWPPTQAPAHEAQGSCPESLSWQGVWEEPQQAGRG